MFGLGLPELIVIFVIALVVFGPKKLPELGKSLGRAIAEFKKASQEFQDSMQEEMKQVEKEADLEKMKKEVEASVTIQPQIDAPKTDSPDAAEKGKNEHV